MIKKIKELINGLTMNNKTIKNNRELDKLYKLLKDEFTFLTFKEIEETYGDGNVNVWRNQQSISIYRYKSKMKLVNYILENIPDAQVCKTYDFLERIEFSFNRHKYEEMLYTKCSLKDIVIPQLNYIIMKNESNSNESFKMLLNKYDDVFVTLHSTILEMKETTGIGQSEKQSIVDILQVFIDEFNSLEALFNKRVKLDQEAIKNSLKRRLEDELTLVNRIKTDWNNIAGVE